MHSPEDGVTSTGTVLAPNGYSTVSTGTYPIVFGVGCARRTPPRDGVRCCNFARRAGAFLDRGSGRRRTGSSSCSVVSRCSSSVSGGCAARRTLSAFWKAGCITKGARPVWREGDGNRRQQCRTALSPYPTVGAVVEVIVAECLEPSKHRVDLGLLGDEGGERLFLRPGTLALGPGAHLWAPHRQL